MNLYKQFVPLRIRRFIRALLYVIKYFPQHISYCINKAVNYRNKFEYSIAIAAIIKNEGAYLKEWIEYHRIVGIEKFIIYDNGSEDNTKEVLQPYIDIGLVDYTWFPGYKMQYRVNNHAIKKWKNLVKYIAIVDIDEFIVPVKYDTIMQVINDVECIMKSKKKLFIGLVIKWVNYGFNGFYSKPDGLITENYQKTDGISKCHKTLFNPRMVIRYQTHDGTYIFNNFGVDENGEEVTGFVDPAKATVNKIRINHYWTKSYEEYLRKYSKGGAISGKFEYKIPDYDPDYLSHNYDPIINKYLPLLKQKILDI